MTDLLNPLLGAWMLISVETQLPNGDIVRAFGDNPQGLIVYTESGHMTAQLNMPDRPIIASNDQQTATEEEASLSFKTYIAYHGTYGLDPENSRVLHHVEGSMFRNWEGDAQERFYEINGNRVTLRTPPVQWGELGTVVTELVWEKL